LVFEQKQSPARLIGTFGGGNFFCLSQESLHMLLGWFFLIEIFSLCFFIAENTD